MDRFKELNKIVTDVHAEIIKEMKKCEKCKKDKNFRWFPFVEKYTYLIEWQGKMICRDCYEDIMKNLNIKGG